MQISAIFPMLCALVAFVLSMLCLFAGNQPGFMEEYHIITLNTSGLGQNLISTTATSSGATTAPTSLGSIFGRSSHDISRAVGGEIDRDLNSIIGDVADELASELGIKQWYSMHLMDMCEGTFTPNATAAGAQLNVTSCTNQTAMYHFNITEQLENELQVGKLHLNLSDIGWPSSIQNGLNDLNLALDALFVLYAMGTAAAGLAIFTSLIALFLHGSRLVLFGNWGLTSFSFFTLLIASLIITIVQVKAVDLINEYGNDIGVYAYKGSKYLILTWVAVAVMLLAVTAWAVEFCIGRKIRKREYTEKITSGGGWLQRRKRSDEASLRSSGV